MFNLFENKTNPDSFIGLVSSNAAADTEQSEINSRKIISGLAVLSLLVISMIANGSQYQTNVEMQKQSTITSYSSAV